MSHRLAYNGKMVLLLSKFSGHRKRHEYSEGFDCRDQTAEISV